MNAWRNLRGFVRALVRGGPDRTPPRHSGHELAGEVRDAIGAQAGGGRGGRMTGSAVYRYLENRKRRSSADS